MTTMYENIKNNDYSILVTGATGFIGKRLVTRLTKKDYKISAMSRTKHTDSERIRFLEADAFDMNSLSNAFKGIEIAFYLLHSMEGTKKDWEKFPDREKIQAQNFLKIAEKEGVKRIIYLGGLVNENFGLSKHMKSRQEVGQILASGNIPVTELRASVIVGAEGGSYAMLRYLVERLPLMVCPKWVKSLTQPISVDNVIDYLVGTLENTSTIGKTFEIGGPEIMTYEQLMRLYSAILNTNLTIIQIPFLTPRLSSYWIDLITPVKASLARPLVDSLVHDSVVNDKTVQEIIPVKLKHMNEAITDAIEEASSFKPITKSSVEKTSYKINQKILLVSLCSMAIIGSTYYWMDDRTDVWEITWLLGSFVWYVSIISAIIFVKQKARLGFLIGGVLAWITIAFWLFDNFYIVFNFSIVASEPSINVTIRNFIGVSIAGLTVFSAHNVFHKVRIYQTKGQLIKESSSAEVPKGTRPVYETNFS